MELEDVENFFSHKFNHKIRLYDGLYHPDINRFWIYNCPITKNSFYIVMLPYFYYWIFPFSKCTLTLLRRTTLRHVPGFGILDIYNNLLYDKNK